MKDLGNEASAKEKARQRKRKGKMSESKTTLMRVFSYKYLSTLYCKLRLCIQM